MKKMYKIIHLEYGDVCGDSYYGKETRINSTYVVFAEEAEVVKLIEDLNKKNHSSFPATDEEIKELKKRVENEQDEFEKDYLQYELDDLYDKDLDYWLYNEAQLDTIEEIRRRYWLD